MGKRSTLLCWMWDRELAPYSTVSTWAALWGLVVLATAQGGRKAVGMGEWALRLAVRYTCHS